MKTDVTAIKRTKRDDVLNAALKLTAEKGFIGTSTANIAEEAKVGMGTIYRYFKSKDVLFSSLFNELRTKFVGLIISNYNFETNAYANFKNIVSVVLQYYIANPYEFKFLERYSDSSLKIDQKFNETTMQLEPLKRMLSNREDGLKFKPLPFFVLFAMIYGPLVAVVNLVHMGKVELSDDMIEEIAESCWKSIIDRDS